jgi:hypothetical protein
MVSSPVVPWGAEKSPAPAARRGGLFRAGSRLAQRCQFFSQRIAAATGRLWLPYGALPMMVRARNPRAIPHAATAAAAHSMMVSTWMTSVSMLSFFSPACKGACCDGKPQRGCLLSYPTVRGFFLRTRCLTPDSTAISPGAVTIRRRARPSTRDPSCAHSTPSRHRDRAGQAAGGGVVCGRWTMTVCSDGMRIHRIG